MSEERESLGLHNLRAHKGATKEPKRFGRGPGSGIGKTSGRGHKGQGSRAGGNVRPGFEGGQMPLIRRVPKRGFHNPARVEYQVVNIRDLARMPGTDISPSTLLEAGMVSRTNRPVKVLGTGTADRAYVVTGCEGSAVARSKIAEAGGRFEA